MTDNNFYNPLLDDDEDEAFTGHSEPAQPNHSEPQFGEKGYRKGVPNTRRGTPRARVTEGNARLLAFLGKFPGSTTEAVSLVRFTEASPVSKGGELPTVRGTRIVLEKLKRLGMVQSFRRDAQSQTQWGATGKGVAAARDFGYLLNEGEANTSGLQGMSYLRLDHYRFIGHVAAQLASPSAYFKDVLGLAPIPLENLISEPHIRRDQKPIRDQLAERKKAKKTHDFGLWRKGKLMAAVKEAEEGKLAWSDLIEANPALRTIGQPNSDATEKLYSSEHWPDLVVHRDDARTDRKAKNLLIEVELHKKSWDEYKRLLRTFHEEFRSGAVYERAVYFTIGTQVETLLRKIDAQLETGLFDSNRLLVLPIRDREGKPVKLKTRVGD